MNLLRTSVVAGALALNLVGVAASADEPRWYRGNTHVHGTVEGLPQETVSGWYRQHGYDFIVQTEHEKVVDATASSEPGKFIVIPGQEITQMVRDDGHPDGVRHTHVNGLGLRTAIMPIRNEVPRPPEFKMGKITPEMFRGWTTQIAPQMTPAAAYARNLAEIRSQGAVPQINHPNLNWSVRLGDLMDLTGPYLLEIANGYPFSNNLGGVSNTGEVALSTEQLWDALLSAGKIVWGVASDDAHEYSGFERNEAMTPGKGWVNVKAASLTPAAITRALGAGQFYASNGVKLKDVQADERGIAIAIDYLPEVVSHMLPSARFKTTFIGRNGRVLQESYGDAVSYIFHGDEQYVRAVIMDSDGRKAWVQPVFTDGRSRLMSSILRDSETAAVLPQPAP